MTACSNAPAKIEPAGFAKRYEKAPQGRDEARKQLTTQQSINETLGARTKDLEAQAAKLAADLDEATKLVEKYETDAKAAPELREQVAKLEEASTKLQHELDEKTEIADTVEGKKYAEILQSRNLFRYAHLHLRSLVLLLALAVGYLFTRPLQAPDSEQPVAAPEPHRMDKQRISFMDRVILPKSAVLMAASIILASGLAAHAQGLPAQRQDSAVSREDGPRVADDSFEQVPVEVPQPTEKAMQLLPRAACGLGPERDLGPALARA